MGAVRHKNIMFHSLWWIMVFSHLFFYVPLRGRVATRWYWSRLWLCKEEEDEDKRENEKEKAFLLFVPQGLSEEGKVCVSTTTLKCPSLLTTLLKAAFSGKNTWCLYP